MLQFLLADCVHLKRHWETKAKFSVNALVIEKSGPKCHAVRARAFPDTESRFPTVDRTGVPGKLYDFDIDKLVSYHALKIICALPFSSSSECVAKPGKESMQMLVIGHIDAGAGNALICVWNRPDVNGAAASAAR